ncbi:MAG TPA: streptolysin S family bacteriocin [Clostridia bacterium]|nr:streptolysin S family bacteriocin [Clostridia bacterium]
MLTFTSKVGATCTASNTVVLAPGSCCCCGGSTCTSTSW